MTKDSYFPALISTDTELKIVEHSEIPIGESFKVLAINPLTPENVLEATKKYYAEKIKEVYDNID